MLIDVMVILAVTNVRVPCGSCGACRGWWGIGEHCICMAFTSKIGARVMTWLPLPPAKPPLIKRCKLLQCEELHERLDCKSMENKWYIYMKVDRVYDLFQPYTRYTKVVLTLP